MKFKHRTEGDILIMAMSGDVMGGPGYEKLRDEVESLIAAGRHKFLFDYSNVRWINSSGIGIMVSLFLRLEEVDGRMVICNANKRVRGIYYVSQLDRVFETYDTIEEGRRALNNDSLVAAS